MSALAERYRTASESLPHWIRCTRSLGNHWRLTAPAKVWWIAAFRSLVLEADRPALASGVPQGMKEIARRSCAIVGQGFCSKRLTVTPKKRLTSSATPECQRDLPPLRVKAGATILSIGIADNPVSTKPSSRVTAVAMPARIAGATTRQKKTPITTSTKADWLASQLKNSGDVSMCPRVRLHKKRAGRSRPM